jgi:hypothetical protein
VANWQAEIEGVALSLLVAAVLQRYQPHSEKVRHDISAKVPLMRKSFLARVAHLSSVMPERRFPPPWTFEEANHACFIIRDANGQALS